VVVSGLWSLVAAGCGACRARVVGRGVSPCANQHSTRLHVHLCVGSIWSILHVFLTISSLLQNGKVLTTGKDIKATQFTLGLTEKQGVKVALGFTKSNELFVGRMAMLGIAASIIGGTYD